MDARGSQSAVEELKRHPIEVVSRRTGLSKDVLRAWERRYSAVVPARTETGRRLYSDDDVRRLTRLRSATEGGRPISQVAGLTDEELGAIEIEDHLQEPAAPLALGDPCAGPLREAREAIAALDTRRLERVIRRAMVALAPRELIEGLISPLMQDVGDRWQREGLSVANEHAATAVIRMLLSEAVSVLGDEQTGAAHLLVGTPASERHDIGALLCAATAAAIGCRVTYVGADVPAEDIARAVRQSSADVVAMSVVHPDDPALVLEELRVLRDGLPADIPIIVGGAEATKHTEAIEALGLRFMNDLGALRTLLNEFGAA